MRYVDDPAPLRMEHKCFTVTLGVAEGVTWSAVFRRRLPPSKQSTVVRRYITATHDGLAAQKTAHEAYATALEAQDLEAVAEHAEVMRGAVEALEGAVGWFLFQFWEDHVRALECGDVWRAGPPLVDGKPGPWAYDGADPEGDLGRDVYAELIADGLEIEHVAALAAKLLEQLRSPLRDASRFDVLEVKTFGEAPAA